METDYSSMADYQMRLEKAFGHFIWNRFAWDNGVTLKLMDTIHHLSGGHASRRTIEKLRRHFDVVHASRCRCRGRFRQSKRNHNLDDLPY